eukprot:scaffold7960_cov350-Prasinococcus_capsulatus_cf.AAC.1
MGCACQADPAHLAALGEQAARDQRALVLRRLHPPAGPPHHCGRCVPRAPLHANAPAGWAVDTRGWELARANGARLLRDAGVSEYKLDKHGMIYEHRVVNLIMNDTFSPHPASFRGQASKQRIPLTPC